MAGIAPDWPVRVTHVVAGLRQADGGPSYSVPRLCAALLSRDVQVRLLTVSAGTNDAADDPAISSAVTRYPQLFGKVPVLGRMRLSFGLRAALDESARQGRILHNHGLWLMPNIAAGRAAGRRHTPLVVSPRGMLASEALAFSRIKKGIVWRTLQGPAFESVNAFHATSEQEAEEIRRFGLRAPIAIIPNGIDLPELAPRRDRLSQGPTVLSLGRLHPKKGLLLLLEAWERVAVLVPDARLRIIGQSERGHGEQLAQIIQERRLQRVTVEPPVYGQDREDAFYSADLFVLPSLNENFGMTVAEALARQVPVLASRGTPWGGLVSHRCGWWVNCSVSDWIGALDAALKLPTRNRAAMGVRGRQWMSEAFGWPAIGESMEQVYRWLQHGAPTPDFVRMP